MFMNDKEYGSLIDEVSKTLRTIRKKKDSEPEDRDEVSIGGKIPLDEVLPPSDGHESGNNDTISHNRHYHGLQIESIEDRLSKLLEEIAQPNDQTTQQQQAARTGQVGTTAVLGHSKGTKIPRTAAAAQRQEVDPYATRGKATRAAKKELESTVDSKDAKKDSEDQSKEAQTQTQNQENQETQVTQTGGDTSASAQPLL